MVAPAGAALALTVLNVERDMQQRRIVSHSYALGRRLLHHRLERRDVLTESGKAGTFHKQFHPRNSGKCMSGMPT